MNALPPFLVLSPRTLTRSHVLACAALAALSSGCAPWHRGPDALTPLPPVPSLPLQTPPYSLPERVSQRIDSRWLLGDDFFPPGARRILPVPAVQVAVRPTPRAEYPSSEPLPSPDGTITLFSDSAVAKRVMVHWLMAYKAGDTRPASLHHTTNTYDVMWSPDNRWAAITEFIGDNRSEVWVVNMREFEAVGPVNVSESVAAHFTAEQLSGPRFVRAQAFGEAGQLLLRVVGRLPNEPYDQFGFELLIDAAHVDDPYAAKFVRGYTAPGAAVR
jgi:hypothetical protein